MKPISTFKLLTAFCCILFVSCTEYKTNETKNAHAFNGKYSGDNLKMVAFPIGGIGAGMFCVEGTGALSHFSLHHHPDVFNEPQVFSAITIKGRKNGTKVLEGQVPDWKIFRVTDGGNGLAGKTYGLPRFQNATFQSRFPFAEISLSDSDIPMEVKMSAWSPFIPLDADNSSLPVGAFEYSFKNTSGQPIEAVYSFNSANFMITADSAKNEINPIDNGFILHQKCMPNHPEYKGEFAAFTNDPNTVVDYAWFRGDWFDPLTVAWKNIESGKCEAKKPIENSPGATLYVPFSLKPGESKTIRVMLAWHVPHSLIKAGKRPKSDNDKKDADKKAAKASAPVCKSTDGQCCGNVDTYEPFYYSKFKEVKEVAEYWKLNYANLKEQTELFTNTFYSSTMPDELMEAVGANLSILKSPTILRQKDGKLWGWEGCGDKHGCCFGSCTHVWNYAQAICNLFPSLERTFRETEFLVSQDSSGHQKFRSSLPIQTPVHDFYAASDGQLGVIMKVYREWKISGDNQWLNEMWEPVKQSINYCIAAWDPRHKGVLEEPHHNTYDIEFWGADGMCTSFYLGALKAVSEMGKYINDKDGNIALYGELFSKGKKTMETTLYNGEYFIQNVQTTGLKSPSPDSLAKVKGFVEYSDEAKDMLKKEGPKYQYGKGCLSDGVLGLWMAELYGLGNLVDSNKVKSHLNSIYKYNLKTDLTDHVNPQRPGFAYGKEGGLLLCTWPKGEMPTLPFVYSNEVWTGIEYQVASHLMLQGMLKEGLDIVRECRKRYDGKVRNPYNEYECGHWYARALSSYALLQGYTGARYDAVDKALYLSTRPGKTYTVFLSTSKGWGTVGLKDGKPVVDFKKGTAEVKTIFVDGKKWEGEVAKRGE